MTTRPRIAVTMGDPAGVGPELCLRLLANESLAAVATPIVFGDRRVLEAVATRSGQSLPAAILTSAQFADADCQITTPAIVDFHRISMSDFQPGTVSAACGAAAYTYIDAAITAAMAHRIDAVCTAPIHKEALAAAGFQYPGHTEIFAALTGATRSCMMLTSNAITCSLVTGHVGYRDVPGLLTVERIVETIELTAGALRRMRGREPSLLLCGLNPHAGENGLFGDREEERILIPALRQAQAKGIRIDGPLPPDTAFLPARRRVTDGYICLYHDQGLIPLKALAFDEAINITLGLPIIRTSVDHGTAFDIAWQGTASPTSLFEAFRLAARLAGMH